MYQLVFQFATPTTIAAFTYHTMGNTLNDPPSVSIYSSQSITPTTLVQSNVPLPVGNGAQVVAINLTTPLSMATTMALQWPNSASGKPPIISGPFYFYSMPVTNIM